MWPRTGVTKVGGSRSRFHPNHSPAATDSLMHRRLLVSFDLF